MGMFFNKLSWQLLVMGLFIGGWLAGYTPIIKQPSPVAAAPITVISNLPPTNDNGLTELDQGRRKGVEVGVPSGGNDYTLTNFRLRMGGTGGECVVEVFTDGGAIPGTLITALESQTIASGIGEYIFTPTAPLTMSAGQTYWFVARCTTGVVNWRASVPSITPTGIFSYEGRAFYDGSWHSNTGYLNSFSIDAEEIISVPTNTPCVISVNPPNLVLPQHRAHTTDTTPTFTWDLINGAQSYRLMVYLEDRSFEYKKRTFNTTYTLTSAEALGVGKYLWRVRTQDQGCSTWSKWSTRNTLFVD